MHLASLAGIWTALVAGFGGLRLRDGSLAFVPRLPEGIARIAFHVVFRNRCIGVDITTTEVRYALLEGEQLVVWHESKNITLSTQEAVIRPTPRIQAGPQPKQPPGRAPLKRAVRPFPRGHGSCHITTGRVVMLFLMTAFWLDRRRAAQARRSTQNRVCSPRRLLPGVLQ
ncbi:glycosyl hydrolase family 65 protein [Ktedonospora formicarum]|uniref:glycosyl hydrolase family 65 protein n=1 Tax=Ktedonospora formicarum TaxID=2778364 RepID=UPI001C6875CD|nr:glycosyl hydrolase family 65 protein [Ktedonospora formicarum]